MAQRGPHPVAVERGPEHFGGGVDQDVKTFFGTEAAGGADDQRRRLGEHAAEKIAVGRIGVDKAIQADGVVDDGDPVVADPCSTDRLGLGRGHAYDLVHPAQEATVEGLVEANAKALARPAPGDGDRGDADPPRGQQAQEGGLVTVAAKDVGGEAAEHARQFLQCGQQPGCVTPQGDTLEAGAADLVEECLAQPGLPKGDEGRANLGRKVLGQLEHLPLGTAKEPRRS